MSVEELAASGRCDPGCTKGRCKPTEFGMGVWTEAAGLFEVCGISFEVLLGVGKVAAAFVEACTSAGSDPQSESTSSVLGADAAPDDSDLLRGTTSVFEGRGEFCFDDSLDSAGGSAAAGAAGLDCSVIAVPSSNFTPKAAKFARRVRLGHKRAHNTRVLPRRLGCHESGADVLLGC